MKIEQSRPFLPNTIETGEKLYEHVFGKVENVASNSTGEIRIDIPFDKCFITEVEIVSEAVFAIADMWFEVRDGSGGYLKVKQHGHGVVINKGLYRRKSTYQADIDKSYSVALYIENPTNGPLDFGFNIILHEAVLA